MTPITFFLFAAASLVCTWLSSFIAANNFSTMLPKLTHSFSTFGLVTLSAILAVTGVAGYLVSFFVIVGASFGPICGVMAAYYVLAGRRWSGPREGINWADHSAWVLGFLVGIPSRLPGMPVA